MKEMFNTDAICVRLVDHDGNLLQAYYTNELDKTLAMYKFACDHDIEIEYREDKLAFIEAIAINFGGDDELLSINLYCNVNVA